MLWKPRILIILIALYLFGLIGWLLYWLVHTAGQILTVPPFKDASEKAWSLVMFCVAIAALVMTLIQIARLLFPVRGAFHRKAMLRWFETNVGYWPSAFLPAGASSEMRELASRGLDQFERLSSRDRVPAEDRSTYEDLRTNSQRPTGPDKTRVRSSKLMNIPAIYDLPLEQLCAQMTIGAESAIEESGEYKDILLCLSGKDYSKQVETLAKAGEGRLESVQEDRIRALLMRTIQRRVDAFQIETGAQWRSGIRSVAVITSVAFSVSITFSCMPGNRSFPQVLSYAVYASLAGILAAFLSMFIRDLTALVEGKRRQQ